MTAHWVEFKKGDTPAEYLSDHEFNVISFYDSSANSQAVQAMIEGVKERIDAALADGSWDDRDLQWLKIDVGKYPHLAFGGEADPKVTQIVYS